MKKSYLSPELDIIVLHRHDIVTDSIGMGEGPGGNVGEARRRNRDAWSEDEE